MVVVLLLLPFVDTNKQRQICPGDTVQRCALHGSHFIYFVTNSDKNQFISFCFACWQSASVTALSAISSAQHNLTPDRGTRRWMLPPRHGQVFQP
jgi:hypothetical protein